MAKYRFGDICEVLNGRAYKQNELLSSGKYPILRVGNFFSSDRWYYSDMELPENKYCDYEDLLFAWSASFGPKIWDGGKVIYHYHIWKLIPNDDVADKFYLYYWLRHSVNRLTAGTHGSVMAHMTKGDMENQSIELPSLQTQKKISSILRTIDEKIHNNEAINNNLEQQAKALYKDWFFDFSPFSSDGNLPNSWRLGTVGDIIQLHDSKRVPLSGAERDKMAKVYPYYGATSLMDYVDDYLFDGIYLLLGEDGTVVDSLGFPILQYVYGQFWVNNHAHIITGKEGFSVEELYLFFSLTNIKSIVTGAVQQKVSQQNLKKVPAIIPSKETLSAFDDLIQPIFAQIRNLRDENANLADLRDTLLPRLMSGELDVSNIKI